MTSSKAKRVPPGIAIELANPMIRPADASGGGTAPVRPPLAHPRAWWFLAYPFVSSLSAAFPFFFTLALWYPSLWVDLVYIGTTAGAAWFAWLVSRRAGLPLGRLTLVVLTYVAYAVSLSSFLAIGDCTEQGSWFADFVTPRAPCAEESLLETLGGSFVLVLFGAFGLVTAVVWPSLFRRALPARSARPSDAPAVQAP